MILAAGRGERLRPLTDTLPKVLIPIGGKPLIVHHLEKLAAANIQHVVINVAHLGEQIIHAVQQVHLPTLTIEFSPEPPGAYETAGGIIHALPLLGTQPFAIVNGDVWTDFPYQRLHQSITDLAHLIVVDNPSFHLQGDFNLHGSKLSRESIAGKHPYTFSGLGIYHPDLFAHRSTTRLPLSVLFEQYCPLQKISGEHYTGAWFNIGTVEQLDQAQTYWQTH
ncbi:MAG: NTP transferase domain-containing protein [Legionellales bacterium]|nr:NTP transferase domain-containing protein [Legionellales bacterium]